MTIYLQNLKQLVNWSIVVSIACMPPVHLTMADWLMILLDREERELSPPTAHFPAPARPAPRLRRTVAMIHPRPPAPPKQKQLNNNDPSPVCLTCIYAMPINQLSLWKPSIEFHSRRQTGPSHAYSSTLSSPDDYYEPLSGRPGISIVPRHGYARNWQRRAYERAELSLTHSPPRCAPRRAPPTPPAGHSHLPLCPPPRQSGTSCRLPGTGARSRSLITLARTFMFDISGALLSCSVDSITTLLGSIVIAEWFRPADIRWFYLERIALTIPWDDYVQLSVYISRRRMSLRLLSFSQNYSIYLQIWRTHWPRYPIALGHSAKNTTIVPLPA